jgi:hypothetical protein
MIFITFDALALPADDLGARQPRPETRRLWNALFPYYHGRLLVIADGIKRDGMGGEQILMEWLKREGFKATSVDFSTEKSSEVIYDRVMALTSVYGKPHWFIDIDPESIAKVARYGIPTLLATIPHTIRPEWEQGREIKGWDTLVEEINKQEMAKKERSWGDIE